MPPPCLPAVTTTVAEPVIIADDAISSPAKASGSDIGAPISVSSSKIDTRNQPLLQHQALEQMKLALSSEKIKMENDCAGLKRKHDQVLQKKELQLQSVERSIQFQELEAKNQACAKESKLLKESIVLDYRTRLLAAYGSYEAAVVQAEKDVARDSLGFGRKAKINILKISSAHDIHPQTLQRYATPRLSDILFLIYNQLIHRPAFSNTGN